MDAGRSAAVYATPRPPPTSSSPILMPYSRSMRAMRSTITSTASGYECSANICEPMWQCRPASRTFGVASTSATQRKAKSSRMVKPNFESSQPVRMYWCVSASTPGVMRI